MTRLRPVEPRNRGSMSSKAKFFLTYKSVLLLRVLTFSPIQCVLRVLSPRIKQQERKAENSPLPGDEAKNCGAVNPLSYMFS